MKIANIFLDAQIELMEVLKRKNIPVAEILDTVNGSKFDLVTLKYFDVKNDDLQGNKYLSLFCFY